MTLPSLPGGPRIYTRWWIAGILRIPEGRLGEPPLRVRWRPWGIATPLARLAMTFVFGS